MKLAVVGVGNAGCRITNRIVDVERSSGRTLSGPHSVLINTEPTGFDGGRVPSDRQLFIGEVHREIDGEGTGGDPDLGATVAEEERHDIVRAFDHIESFAIDGLLVVAGLGRGTGGGVGPVVIDALQSIYDEPVYALVVLPGADEGPARALNAARSLQSFVERADNVIAFDNGAWREDEGRPDQDYEAPNAALATRIVTLFAAGEFGADALPENRLDPSDIMRTLATGGVSSIGYASIDLDTGGWLRYWLRGGPLSAYLPWVKNGQTGRDDEESTTDAVAVNNLVRRATHSQLTLPCEVSSAERALVMLSGPPSALSRKGFESGRYWLEQEADTAEVMAGDEPHDRATSLTATVLLSNVTDVPRIEEMQEQALAE